MSDMQLFIIPATRLRLHDEDLVSGLADQVTTALRNAIDGRPADQRPLAVGLLGALGQLPTVFSFEEASRHHLELATIRAVTRAAAMAAVALPVATTVMGGMRGGSTAGYIATAGRTASGPTDSGHSIDDRGTGMLPTISVACPNLAAYGALNRLGSEGDSGYAAGANRHASCCMSAGQVS